MSGKGTVAILNLKSKLDYHSGNLPVDRYPLVSRVPPNVGKGKQKQVTLEEWDRLASVLAPNEAQEMRDRDLAKREQLKAASEELKRGWPDTNDVRFSLGASKSIRRSAWPKTPS